MKLGRFIPNNIKQDGDYGFSTTASRFASLTIAVGLLALIIAFAILNGFKKHIRNVVYDFNGEYQISSYSSLTGGEPQPIRTDSGFYKNYKERFPEVESVFALANKGFLLQYENQIEGLMIKGYDDNGCESLNSKLIEGKGLSSDSLRNVLVSDLISKKMNLKVGDSFIGNFFTDRLKNRKLKVVGIYKTNLSDFDNLYVMAPIGFVRNLNKWQDNHAESFEVHLKEGAVSESSSYFKEVLIEMGFLTDVKISTLSYDGFYNYLHSETDFDLSVSKTNYTFFHLFQWLMILDQNVQVLIVILFVLVLFSVISTMYIIIYERNHMVGVLKSLGASNKQVLSFFINKGLKIGLWGFLVGNLLAFGFLIIQKNLKVIKLDPEHYYMDFVPVEIDLLNVFWVNLISALVVFVLLQIPYLVVMKMKPVENLRFN